MNAVDPQPIMNVRLNVMGEGMVWSAIGARTGSNDALYSAEFLYRVGGCGLIFIGPTMTITTICRRLIVV